MACTEAVKEMHKGDGAFDGAEMRDNAQIHAFLHAGGSELRPARLAAGHRVGMITENGDRMGGKSPCRHMHNARELGTGDAIHGRDHQHQALRGRIRGGEGPCFQRAVHRAAGAGFTFQFYQLHRLAEQILLSVGRPVIHVVGHRAGRGNRIDRGNFGKRIGSVCRRFVAVHCFFGQHDSSLFPYCSGCKTGQLNLFYHEFLREKRYFCK